MTETLVIRLRASDEAPASWLIVDANGAKSGPVTSGPVADALSVAQGRRVVVLLPGTDVGLAEPELPFRGTARLTQAVPFALEEQLASELEGLHFAVGSRVGDSPGTPVAVVARGTMDRWKGLLDAAGIQPAAAFAETEVVPVSPNGCTLLLDDQILYVRRADGVPFALDAQPLEVALGLALGPATEAGEHVVFYATSAEYEQHRDLIEGLRARTATLQVKLMPEGSLPLLAAQLSGAKGVNLLQGSYQPPTSLGSQLKLWRVPLALAAAVLLVFLLDQGMSLWRLHRDEKQLDAQIAEVIKQMLPGQKIAGPPRAQVEDVLRRAGGGGGALLPAMSLLARAVARFPAIQVQAVSFRSGSLELHLVAPSTEALDAVKQSMNSNGFTAELQSATPRGQVVEGRLQVKLGAA
jgi:general secretion pathway protein L